MSMLVYGRKGIARASYSQVPRAKSMGNVKSMGFEEMFYGVKRGAVRAPSDLRDLLQNN